MLIFKKNYSEKDGVKNDNPSFFSARVSKYSSLKDLIKLDKNVKVEGIPCGASPEEIAEMEDMINDICNSKRKDMI